VVDRSRALSFGAVADLYDSHRPAYPGALIDDVITSTGCPEPRVLEVGAGTGKATRDLAARGARIVAIEPDSAMAAVNRRGLSHGVDVDVVVSTFEAAELPDAAFDLVASGQAWHWVDPTVGFAKARRVLRPGGHLAMFWNAPRRVESEVRTAIDAVYERVVPGFIDQSMMGGGRVSRETGVAPDAAEHFGPPDVRTYDWGTTYTTAEYLGLLRTHSDHGTLPPEVLVELLDGVGAAIDARGGSFDFAYRAVLLLLASTL
jgi:SAM-dependent methyltransferase